MKRWQRWLAGIAGAAALVAAAACEAADETARETRSLAQPFNEVRLRGSFDLELTQSDTVSLEIEAAREDLPNILSEVEDGVLTLRHAHPGPLELFGWFGSRHATPRVFLSARTIDRLVLEGSGDIHVGPWTHHAMELRLSGSGDVRFDRLTATRFTCDLGGSGKVVAAGSVTNQKIRVSGSGAYRASDLKSQTATVSVSGAAQVDLWVERTLDARISGAGTIRYYGTPAVSQNISGAGVVTGLGPKGAPPG